MATLNIVATPTGDLRRYRLAIGGADVPMKADNTGECEVAGACGDGSTLRLTYSLFGSAGAKLNIALACGGTSIGTTGDIEIYPEGEPFAAGWQDFQL
jgi:hypothetical protein